MRKSIGSEKERVYAGSNNSKASLDRAPRPPVTAKPRRKLATPTVNSSSAPATVTTAKSGGSVVKEKASGILEKSSALRDYLPAQLASVFGVPPPLAMETPPMNISLQKISSSLSMASPTTVGSSTASYSGNGGGGQAGKISVSEESVEETLRQIRNACSTFSLESPGSSLPVISTSHAKGSTGGKSGRSNGSTASTTNHSGTGGGEGGGGNSARNSIRWGVHHNSTSSSLNNNNNNTSANSKGEGNVLAGLAVTPESERITHRILHIQLLLFPSTFREDHVSPTPPVATNQNPSSARRISGSMATVLSSEDSGPNFSPFTRSAMQGLESPASKKAWKAIFKKPRSTFPILIAACRSELLLLDMCVAASILTLVYNLLRATPQDQQKKVVRLCVKLGLLRVCASVLQAYSGNHGLRGYDGVGTPSSPAGPTRLSVRARVCEASAVLLALAATYDPKVLSTARASRAIAYLATAADTYGGCLEQRVTQYRSLSDFDCTMPSTKNAAPSSSSVGVVSSNSNQNFGASVGDSGGNVAMGSSTAGMGDSSDSRLAERRATLLAIKKFLCRTECVLQSFLHVILALNILSKSPANVQEMGTVVASISVKVFTAVSFFLTHLCPKLLLSVASSDVTHLLRLAAHVEAVGNGYYVASFVMQGIRNFESTLFWSLTLLDRLCTDGPLAERCIHEVNTHHILRSLFKIIKHVCREEVALAPPLKSQTPTDVESTFSFGMAPGPNQLISPGYAISPVQSLPSPTPPPNGIQCLRHPRLVKASLHAFATIVNGDRARGLKDLKEVGSLAQLTQNVLKLKDVSPSQWLHYYHYLCDIHGVCFLPAPPSNNPHLADFNMNLRVPMDILQDVLKINVEDASGDEGNDSSGGGLGEPQSSNNSYHRDHSSPSIGTGWNGVLLADLHPEWFSPELAGGHIESSTRLPPLDEVRMPWPFTDLPPPPTFEDFCSGLPESHQGRRRTSVASNASFGEESSDNAPLVPPSAETISRILQHHIQRLLLLPAEASDYLTLPVSRHKHQIVYERKDRKIVESPLVSSPYASTPSFSKQNSVSASMSAAVSSPFISLTPQSIPSPGSLSFGSNFECGNLQRAVQVSPEEYDLVLSFDTATNSYVQWFCFSVTQYNPGTVYRFNIVNMEKTSSTFNDGQRPLMLHVPSTPKLVTDPLPRWRRVGGDIYYFPNSFRRPARECARKAPPGKDVKVSSKKAPALSKGGKSSRRNTVAKSVGESSTRSSRKLVPSGRYPKTANSSFAAANPSSVPGVDSGSPAAAALSRESRYYTLTFTVKMPTLPGTVYLANCFPFSYSDLRRMVQIQATKANCAPPGKEFHNGFFVQNLCPSACGIPIPLITATAMFNRTTNLPYSQEEIQRRPVCLMTARVHPGESNSSWMMNGIVDFLATGCRELIQHEEPNGTGGSGPLSEEKSTAAVAATLLESFVFKVIPMLNVDGVIMGNHRCSIVGIDMNRDYLNPSSEMNPTLYALKRVISYMTGVTQRHVVMGADFHGHSRAKNFLLYGCTRATLVSAFKLKGKISLDTFTDESTGQVCNSVAPEKLLPSLLAQYCPAFDLTRTNFAVQKSKANTNRVVLYREYGIRMCYGVEATMMGGRSALLDTYLDAMREDRTFAWSSGPANGNASPSVAGGVTALGSTGSTASGHVSNHVLAATSVYTTASGNPAAAERAAADTHYNQSTYCSFGVAFLWSLHGLLVSEREINKVCETGFWEEEESPAMKRAWAITTQAGAGRSAPCNETDRLQWMTSLQSFTAKLNTPSPSITPGCSTSFSSTMNMLSNHQRRDVLFQLLRGSQTTVRLEDCVMDGDDEEDEDGGDGDGDDDDDGGVAGNGKLKAKKKSADAMGSDGEEEEGSSELDMQLSDMPSGEDDQVENDEDVLSADSGTVP